MKLLKNYLYLICVCVTVLAMCPLSVRAGEQEHIIVLDPGHGGTQSGAEREYDGETIYEKDINLKIGLYLKKELEKYKNVTVCMTRDEDRDVELEERTRIGKEHDADLLVSLHNNAWGGGFVYNHGCTVLVSQCQYKEKLGEEEQKLGVNILNELSLLGIEDQGLLLRDSESGETYDNGSVADYYAIIRNGINQDLMSIIIEHAFLDHKEDYRDFLSDDEKLRNLAEADARGIARYFGLMKKGTKKVLKPLENREEVLLHLVDQNPEHNETSRKVFYEAQEETIDETDISEIVARLLSLMTKDK